MKIALFGAKAYDRQSFDSANEKYGYQIDYLEPRLSNETVALAADYLAVCIFVNDHVNAEVITKLASYGTKLIALRCAGFNNVDISSARKAGMTICRVPAYSPHAVAEHTLALILTLNRKTHKAYNRVREGNFMLDGLMGFDLFGKSVGIIGTGQIGLCVCQILHGFGCKILAHDPYPNPQVVALGIEYAPLEKLYVESDIISLHCPLTPQTKHVINAQALQLMKPSVMLINTGRGALIDTRAVVQALKDRRVGWLGLDVYEEEDGIFFEDQSAEGLHDDQLARLISFPNVLVTGHQAFLTAEALTSIAETTLANIQRFGQGLACPNRLGESV